MKNRLIIQIVLGALSIVLAVLIYRGIMFPIKFNREVDTRKAFVVERLKDIRSAQLAFRNVNGYYTSDFDSLIMFINEGKIPIIRLEADPDDTTFTKQIIDTVGYATIIDSIFKNRENFNVNEIKFIPFSGKKEFELNAGTTIRGGVTVNVVEVFAANKYWLKDKLDDMIKFNMNPEDGLRFGSMTDPTTDGNWE